MASAHFLHTMKFVKQFNFTAFFTHLFSDAILTVLFGMSYITQRGNQYSTHTYFPFKNVYLVHFGSHTKSHNLNQQLIETFRAWFGCITWNKLAAKSILSVAFVFILFIFYYKNIILQNCYLSKPLFVCTYFGKFIDDEDEHWCHFEKCSQFNNALRTITEAGRHTAFCPSELGGMFWTPEILVMTIEMAPLHNNAKFVDCAV